ncbi:addiction module protein [Nitratifractor sp.]
MSSIELEKMDPLEKLRVMELLWEDLYRHFEDAEIPEWHQEVLDRREKEAGDRSDYLDWDEVRKELLAR